MHVRCLHKPEKNELVYTLVILISQALPCRYVLEVVSTHLSNLNCKRTVSLSSHMCIGLRYEKDHV